MERVTSSVCRYDHFTTDWYKKWASILKQRTEVSPDKPTSYRKVWEWTIILEAIQERGLLCRGKKALGFAVGREPVPCALAGNGVQVLATDLGADQSEKGWIDTGQHSSNKEQLYFSHLAAQDQFDSLVSFQPADMRTLAGLPENEFDFIWSSCALEHLGNLENGRTFVKNAMKMLKSGGIAFHTTEYNVSSNSDTVREGSGVLYRKKDFEELAFELRDHHCAMEKMDFDCGHHRYDLLYDEPPYLNPGKVHIKLKLDGFITTSALMIVHKA